MPIPLLTVENLSVRFKTPDQVINAVNGVSFSLNTGETLGIVGESGSGKTVTVLSILGLIPKPPGEITGGKALFEGQDLLPLSTESLRSIRGQEISMVFQDPMTSLNPVIKVGEQLREAPVDPQSFRIEVKPPTARHRIAGHGGDPATGTALQPVSPRVLGRNAPARHDRHGHGPTGPSC